MDLTHHRAASDTLQTSVSAPTVLEFSAFRNGWAAEVSPVLLKKSKLNSINEGKSTLP